MACGAGKKEDGSEEPETEIAIKKVLQDKRFKVRLGHRWGRHELMLTSAEPRIADHATCQPSERRGSEGIFLLERRQGE